MTDIFSDPPNSGDNQPSPQGSTGDPLNELVGEGKKFKTVEDLARSKLESDKFIEQLKREGAEMRHALQELEGKVGKQRTIDDVLSAIKEVRGTGDNQALPTTEDLLKLVDSRIRDVDAEKSRNLNAERAQAALLDKFQNDAAKAREFVRIEASRLGMKPEELRSLAQTSPEAFSRILGLNQPKSNGQASLRTEVNTEATMSNGSVRNESYYKELKAKLGQKFWDPAIQRQRFKDVSALGQKYYE
jgi:hypothetical protein